MKRILILYLAIKLFSPCLAQNSRIIDRGNYLELILGDSAKIVSAKANIKLERPADINQRLYITMDGFRYTINATTNTVPGITNSWGLYANILSMLLTGASTGNATQATQLALLQEIQIANDTLSHIYRGLLNKYDTTHTGILQQIANNTSNSGTSQFEHKEWRMMFNTTYTKHTITPGILCNQLYINNLCMMQDVGDRTFRGSDGSPYVIYAAITYDVGGNQFTEWQSFEAGVTTYNFTYSKVVEITFFVIKDHNSYLDGNGGLSEIKPFPVYEPGELGSTIYANVKLIRDVKE